MKRHALFIGIDRYEDEQLRSLDCAEEDAVELHGFFKHRAGYHAQCLRSPSSEEVLATVERLMAGLAPGDLFLFFFAGHGVTHEGRHLLLCSKARHARLRYLQQVLPVDLLKEETARAGVHRVFVLDACRSDLLKTRRAGDSGFTGANALRDVVARPAENATASDGSLTLVCSCDEGGQASEIPSLRGGVFRLALTETLAAAVEDERELSVGEDLVSEVEERMTRLAEDHGIAARQRPWFQRVGAAPLLLSGRGVPGAPAFSRPALASRATAEARQTVEAEARLAAEQAAAAETKRLAEIQQQEEERERERGAALIRQRETEAEARRLAETQRQAEEIRQAEAIRLADEEKERSRIPADATQAHPWINSLGMKFVPVPGTEVLFCKWQTRLPDYGAFARANSGVGVEWQAGWQGPGHSIGDVPTVVNVSWNDAKKFCAWLTMKERQEELIPAEASYRLPADWEWSIAAGLNEPRAGTPEGKDGRIHVTYPWGTHWPPPKTAENYARSQGFAANQHGLYDLGGKVWEWCEDEMRFLFVRKGRVLRGASWDIFGAASLPTSRYFGSVNCRNNLFGFRCVLANFA